jgi:hypothetical protein
MKKFTKERRSFSPAGAPSTATATRRTRCGRQLSHTMAEPSGVSISTVLVTLFWSCAGGCQKIHRRRVNTGSEVHYCAHLLVAEADGTALHARVYFGVVGAGRYNVLRQALQVPLARVCARRERDPASEERVLTAAAGRHDVGLRLDNDLPRVPRS